MKKIILAAVLTLGLAHGQTAKDENKSHIVLPNPKLLRCKSSDCFQLWQEKSVQSDAIFPKQFIIDMNQGCLYGMTALYDKSIWLEDVQAAIDERCAESALPEFKNSKLKLWRVEPEKFAIWPEIFRRSSVRS